MCLCVCVWGGGWVEERKAYRISYVIFHVNSRLSLYRTRGVDNNPEIYSDQCMRVEYPHV